MLEGGYLDTILNELQTELKHQNDFIEKLKGFNNELEENGFQPLYSVKQVITSGEQNAYRIKRAIAEIPLEDADD